MEPRYETRLPSYPGPMLWPDAIAEGRMSHLATMLIRTASLNKVSA